MKGMKILLFSCFIALTLGTVAQQTSSEKEPKFGYLQCRADAQKWTVDPFDSKSQGGMLILVNGQLRGLSHLTYGATMTTLMQRAYESGMCKTEDADFEKQYSTYSTLQDSYTEEQLFRYKHFVINHHLEQQFTKEDTEEFK